MRKLNPQIKQFTYYPLVAIRDSYITLQWQVENAFFVYIDNGIGLKKAKGIQLSTLNKSGIYKITAFGWFGKSTKEIHPMVLNVSKLLPKPQLVNKIESIEQPLDVNSTPIKNTLTVDAKLKNARTFKLINKLRFRYKALKICPDIDSLNKDLKQLQACKSTDELNNLKDTYYV